MDKPDLSKGWRKLDVGEVIRDGDWIDSIEQWASGLVGSTVNKYNDVYRREVYDIYRKFDSVKLLIEPKTKPKELMLFLRENCDNSVTLMIDGWSVLKFRVVDGEIVTHRVGYVNSEFIKTDDTKIVVQ